MAGTLPSTSVRQHIRANGPNRSTCGRALTTAPAFKLLHVHRPGNRSALVVVAAKGKGKKSAQATYDEVSYEEDIGNLPALEFVIEEEDDLPVQDDWSSKGGKKGKGKGKKQKKKRSVWDGPEEDDYTYTTPTFAAAPVPVVSSYEEAVTTTVPPLQFIEEDVEYMVEEPYTKPQVAQQSRSKRSYEEDVTYMEEAPYTEPLGQPRRMSSYEGDVAYVAEQPYTKPQSTQPSRTSTYEEDVAYMEQQPYSKPQSAQPSRTSAYEEDVAYIEQQPYSKPQSTQPGRSSYEEDVGYAPQQPYRQPQFAQPSRAAGSYEEDGYSARPRQERGGYNNSNRRFGPGGLPSTRGQRPAGQRSEEKSNGGWYDAEKRKEWADKRARVFSRVTTQEINAAETWEAVADILQARDRILDHIHITAALTVVSKVTDLNSLQESDQERFEQLLADIYRKLYQMVNKLGPRELATNLLSLARLGYTSDEVVQALLTASLPKLKQFNAIELCNAIYALGQMSYVPFQDWIDMYFEASEARLSQFKPLELANSINALGQLNRLPPPSWLNAFFSQAQASLQGFTARDISTMLYGLGMLGARPSNEWLLACSAASMRGLKGGRVTDLKRGVWALSQFDYTPDFKWQNTFVTRAKSLLDYFSAEDLLTTTLAMAYLRFSVVDPDFVRRLVSKIQERRGRFDEESLGSLNNALEVLGHKGARIQPVVAKALAMA